MNKSAISTHSYLHPPLWNSRLVLGQWVINLSLRRRHDVKEHSPLPHIGNRLAALRAEHGISRQELADILNVTGQTLEALERGSYTPSLELAFRASRYFGLPIGAIFFMHIEQIIDDNIHAF